MASGQTDLVYPTSGVTVDDPREAPPRAAVIQRFALGVRPWKLAVLTSVLAAPALSTGWSLDDHLFRLRVAVWPLRDVLAKLFVFWSGSPAETQQTMDAYGIPWWTDPELRVAFWRPLAALTHWLDYELWGDRPWAAHAQSLLWLALLVFLVARFYRRLLGPTVAAGLAAFFFAVDGAHGSTVGWIASRNTLLVAVLAVATLFQHDRWRRDGSRRAMLVAPLCFATGLLAGEGEVGVLGYLAGYALFLDRGTLVARARSLAGYAAVLVGWRALYQHMGYGTFGSAFYADPAREPLRFLASLFQHGPVLLLAQWAEPPSELYTVSSIAEQRHLVLQAFAVLLALATVVAPLVWRSRSARFWTLGMLVAVVPISATIPEDRLLVLVGIGAFGLVGELLADVWLRPVAWLPSDPVWRVPALVVAVLLFLLHGVQAPFALLFRSSEITTVFPEIEQLALGMPTDRSHPDEQVVVVQGGLPVGFYYPEIRLFDGRPLIRTRVLAPEGDVRISRADARTLRVRPRDGYIAEAMGDDLVANQRRRFDRFVRTPDRPFARGDTVHLQGVDVSVTELNGDGRPAEATFRFAVPLEDPSLLWVVRRGLRWAPFRPPAVGQSVLVESEP